MMVRTFMERGIVATIVFILSVGAFCTTDNFVEAQGGLSTFSLTIAPGELLELAIPTRAFQPEYNWILSREGNFISAGRSPIFQTRQTDAGVYTIDVNVLSEGKTITESYSLQLNVNEHVSTYDPSGQKSGEIQAVLESLPPASDGSIRLPADGGVLTLIPGSSYGDIASYDIDFDIQTDTNGDGIPDNDRDTQGTYSQKAGTPVRVLLRPQGAPHTLSLTVSDVQGHSSSTVSTVRFDGAATIASSQASHSTSVKSGDFILSVTGRTISPSLAAHSSLQSNHAVLYEWEFGDGRKSLLHAPRHTYDQPGDYSVSLTVRDIANGQLLYSGSTSVKVTEQDSVSSAPIQEIHSSVVSSASTEANGDSRSYWSIIKAALIFLVLIQIGLALFHLALWIKRKSTGALHTTIEKMEHSLFEQEKNDEDTLPSVMPLKKIDKPDVATGVQEEVLEPIAPVPPAQEVAVGPVPDWLKNAPTEPVIQTSSEVTATQFEPQVQVSPPQETAPVPSWLSDTAATTPSPDPPAPPTVPTASAEPYSDLDDEEDYDDEEDAQEEDEILNERDFTPPQDAQALPDWLMGENAHSDSPPTEASKEVHEPLHEEVSNAASQQYPEESTHTAVVSDTRTPSDSANDRNDSPPTLEKRDESLSQSGEILPMDQSQPFPLLPTDDDAPIAIVRAESVGTDTQHSQPAQSSQQ